VHVRTVVDAWAMLARQISQTRMSPAATATPVIDPVTRVAMVWEMPGSVAWDTWSYRVATTAPVLGRHTYRQNVTWKLAWALDSTLAKLSVHAPVGRV
jgi:hypothetical protein